MKDSGSEKKSFTTGELAELGGVSTRTVRYYEEIGILKAVERKTGGRRLFDDDALERLRFIGRLKRFGLTLEEIREVNSAFELQSSTKDMLKVLQGILDRHISGISERIEELDHLRGEVQSYKKRIQQRMRNL